MARQYVYVTVMFCGRYEDYNGVNVYAGTSFEQAYAAAIAHEFNDYYNQSGYIEVWYRGTKFSECHVREAYSFFPVYPFIPETRHPLIEEVKEDGPCHGQFLDEVFPNAAAIAEWLKEWGYEIATISPYGEGHLGYSCEFVDTVCGMRVSPSGFVQALKPFSPVA